MCRVVADRCRSALRTAVAVVLAAITGVAIAAQNPVSGPAQKKDEFQTAAPYAILIDAETNTVLYEKAADQLTAPSSLAKLMTAEVVFNELKSGRIKLDDEFLISEDAWRRGGAPSHTSSMFAPIHSRVRVEDLIRGMIIQSGNDACIALAQGIAGGEPKFAQTMTQRARELGLEKSYFANATGLPDPTMRVTVRELARLARHIVRTYPEFYPIYGEKEFTWNKIRQQNRNPLLAMNIGADGMKTGFTEEGGYGLVGSAVQNGMRLIVAINGLKSASDRASEGRRLIEWGFKGFESRPLFADGQAIGDAKVYGGASSTVPLVADGMVGLLIPRGSGDRVLARISYTGPVRAPVEKGRRLATLKVWRGDRIALEVPLMAGEDVPVGSLTRRAVDAATELVISLFRAGAKRI